MENLEPKQVPFLKRFSILAFVCTLVLVSITFELKNRDFSDLQLNTLNTLSKVQCF